MQDSRELTSITFEAGAETDTQSVQEDSRTGAQILRSILQYLEWRASRGRSGQLSREQRNDPLRWYYIDAYRAVGAAAFNEAVSALNHLTPFLLPDNSIDPRIRLMVDYPRAMLVSALMRLDPSLTNKRMLGGLRKAKLAAMICERLDRPSNVAEMEVCA